MLLKVEAVTTAKSGKSLRVMAGGKWYGAGKDSGLSKGMTVEAETSDGDYGLWIDKWKPANGSAGQPVSKEPATESAGLTGSAPAMSDNVAPWYMPFVSNTVAHAIQAGHCTTPDAINQWAIKAAQVAVATKEAV